MKQLFTILFIAIYVGSAGQTWQLADPSGVRYTEPTTGTAITINKSSITITTTPEYTGISTPTYLETVIYDSLGYFIEKLIIRYPDPPSDICEKLYKYTTSMDGEFIFTIYGKIPYQQSLMCYSIIIFTYRAQQKYETFIKSILR